MYCDFSKALHTVSHDIPIIKLQKYCLDENIARWYITGWIIMLERVVINVLMSRTQGRCGPV